ncbi:MAG: FixH family protein [Sulfurimonas sp.]|nr:FixH family protein [Sulfurimonas sp.]
MNFSSGRIWPYAIGISITLVFGFCVTTVMVTSSANIQPSELYMTHYQDADANANKLIYKRMAFDKKYKIDYISNSMSENESFITYKITDLNDKPIEEAKVIVATSRPETSEFNQNLVNPTVENGVYTFSGAKFPKVGVWNIMAKIDIGDNSRYLNIKADTRNSITYEF